MIRHGQYSRWLAGSICAAIISAPFALADIYTEQASEDVLVRTLIFPATALTQSRAEEESRRFLTAAKGRKLRLCILRLATNATDARMMNGGIGRIHSTAKDYAEASLRVASSLGTIAELAVTHEGAVLRFRKPGEKPVRMVLQGRDPLYGLAGGIDYEILYVAVRRSPALRRGERESLRTDCSVVVHGPLSDEAGMLIHRSILTKFAPGSSISHIRTDGLFTGEEFPVVYPFDERPAAVKRGANPTLVCSSDSDRVSCHNTM